MLGGWQTFTNPTFKNQGDCVAFVNLMNNHYELADVSAFGE